MEQSEEFVQGAAKFLGTGKFSSLCKEIRNMEKTKHTPGPLGIKYLDGSRVITTDDGHGRIATVHMRKTKTNNLEEMDANARLIAAAPDLLAALSEIIGAFDILKSESKLYACVPEIITRHESAARAVIAQAEGKE